jgi:acetylornithine/succinyldiaminopimelate/putrescine aminotransferase
LTVPFADIDAVERLLDEGEVAAVLLESIPATWGFAVPPAEYLPEVVRLAHEHGALFIADEVQVGLGRTGRLWSVETFGIEPDILVAGKGLSGGVYPIAATVMNPRAGHWLFENGWGHSSTYGGSEIGCRVGQKVLEITTRAETVANVEHLAAEFGGAFDAIATEDPYLVEVRQCGVIFGLRFDHPAGAAYMQRELYTRGVWAIASGYDESVLQFKPGLLLEREAVGDVMDRFRAALEVARDQDYEIVRRQPMARA